MSPRPRSLALSFFLALTTACTAPPEPAAAPPGSRTVNVGVGTSYTPSEITASPGEALHLVFTRTTDEGCGQQLVFPDLDIQRDLPLDQPVAVDVTAPASGRLAFTCGMAMYRGAIVVR
jgi:plastocyanin domain-containing protein